MNKKILLFYFLLINSGIIYAQTPSALINFLNKKELAHASVSLKAIELNSKKVIVSHNENTSLVPASNMKIITTATALEVLGSNFYFETPLFYDGYIQESTLNGNIYIKGSGDPTLGSEFISGDAENFLKEWLTALNQIGISKITGNVVVMDQLFGYEGTSTKWLKEDLGSYYAPGIYGISVFDNMYRIYLQTYAPKSPASILYTKPQMLNLHIVNELKVTEDADDDALVFSIPFADDVRLYGAIPSNRSTYILKGSIPDPGLFLARSFRDYLQNNGIIIEGKATTSRLSPEAPSGENPVSTIRSVDLGSICKIINVESNNLYAEHIWKVLTVLDSIDIKQYWKSKGVNSDALFMFDGSGISPQNGISAGFLIDLLVYMDKQSVNSDVFYKSLPVAGRSGTIASLLKNSHLTGNARLKSGSITNVQSYSGYIESKGKRYAVSLIVNNFSGKRADLRREIEQLFNELF